MSRKQYDELTFTDDFMFCKVMENNPDLCKEIVELILGEKIGAVAQVQHQHAYEAGFDTRGVRFDVHIKDDESRIFDCEMQTWKEADWAKRSRFYASSMDIEQLEKGQPISKLNDTWVIFICDFQILPKYNLAKYNFHKVCEQKPEYVLEDGTHLIMLCADNTDEMISPELNGFLRYVATGQPVDDFTKRLQKEVEKGRISKEWRREYMLFSDHLAKERAEGRIEGLTLYVEEKLAGGAAEAEIVDFITQRLAVSREEAQRLVDQCITNHS